MVDCRDLVDLLGDYLDDEMAADLRASLEQHLSHCRSCQVIVDSTRKTVRIVTESGSFEVPGEMSERIVDRIMRKIPGGSGGAGGSGGGNPGDSGRGSPSGSAA